MKRRGYRARYAGARLLTYLNKLGDNFGSELPKGLVLFDASWHQGVIGILASRIKDRFHRPVIVFAEGQEGELKGSARSISGLHIRDVLALIDVERPGFNYPLWWSRHGCRFDHTSFKLS